MPASTRGPRRSDTTTRKNRPGAPARPGPVTDFGAAGSDTAHAPAGRPVAAAPRSSTPAQTRRRWRPRRGATNATRQRHGAVRASLSGDRRRHPSAVPWRFPGLFELIPTAKFAANAVNVYVVSSKTFQSNSRFWRCVDWQVLALSKFISFPPPNNAAGLQGAARPDCGLTGLTLPARLGPSRSDVLPHHRFWVRASARRSAAADTCSASAAADLRPPASARPSVVARREMRCDATAAA